MLLRMGSLGWCLGLWSFGGRRPSALGTCSSPYAPIKTRYRTFAHRPHNPCRPMMRVSNNCRRSARLRFEKLWPWAVTGSHSSTVNKTRQRQARFECPSHKKRSTLSAARAGDSSNGKSSSRVSAAACRVRHSQSAKALPGATCGRTRYANSSNVSRIMLSQDAATTQRTREYAATLALRATDNSASRTCQSLVTATCT
ncbi:MAG: hypothetical protein RL701_935 [Pseudomonadota bacterium]